MGKIGFAPLLPPTRGWTSARLGFNHDRKALNLRFSSHRLFAPFAYRNYRLYFAGQVVSLTGTWVTQTASLWLAYHMTSSPSILGLVAFANQAPIFFFAPFAGVWIDRMDRLRLLVITQALAMLQSTALAALTYTGTMQIPHLIGLCLFQGLINAFDMPARQALVVDLVDRREHLGNAIALNSSMFNLARLAGPAVAGWLIAAYGVAWCYGLDALSYAAVIAALLAMRIRPREVPASRKHPWAELREGLHYAFGFAPIRALIVLVGTISGVGFTYSIFAPIYARDVFGGDARLLGSLMAAAGTGALLGAVYLGTRRTVRGLGLVITFGGAAMGFGLIGFALSRWLTLSMASLALTGLGGVLLMASSNTLLQTLVHDSKRGRVMSLFTMAFTGTTPLGSLVAGFLAARLGPTPTLIVNGLICLGVIALFFRRLPELRAAAAPTLAAMEESTTGGASQAG